MDRNRTEYTLAFLIRGISSVRALFRSHPHLLLFGLLTAMFSGPGQTFLVSLFIPGMRDSFAMTQTGIAGLYSGATLLSAFLLPWIGRLLDRVHLIRFTLAAAILLALGCLVLGLSNGWFLVLTGFLLVRNLGQATMSMLSSTTMARAFGSTRGKALGIANLGYPLSEAVFPVLITTWNLHFGWRAGWCLLAFLTLLFFLPAALMLLGERRYEKTLAAFEKKLAREAGKEDLDIRHWHVREVLRDWRFYVLLFPSILPPAFLTALFFHQASLMVWKGWGLEQISLAFVAFAVTRAFCSFFAGPLIDRFSAMRLFPLTLLPLAAAVLVLEAAGGPVWSFLYLGLAGMNMGFGMTIKGALWAELYGTRELGSIRGMMSSIMVLATAAAPIGMGLLLDRGIPPQWFLSAMGAAALFGSWAAQFALRTAPVSRP